MSTAEPAPDAPDKPSAHEKVVYERRSLAMTPDQWKALEKLATTLGATARGGPKRGQPSWRTMIAQLADEAEETIKAIQQQEAIKDQVRADLANHKTPITRAGDLPA